MPAFLHLCPQACSAYGERTGSSICDTSVSFRLGRFWDCWGQKCNLVLYWPWDRTEWQMPPTEPAVRCNGQSRLVPRDKGAFFLLFSASNAYLHSPETEYKITDHTWIFYETWKKQGRYLAAGWISRWINSVPPKSSFPCWQLGCAWSMSTLTVVENYGFKWMLDLLFKLRKRVKIEQVTFSRTLPDAVLILRIKS